jgi:hypothetical protein
VGMIQREIIYKPGLWEIFDEILIIQSQWTSLAYKMRISSAEIFPPTRILRTFSYHCSWQVQLYHSLRANFKKK